MFMNKTYKIHKVEETTNCKECKLKEEKVDLLSKRMREQEIFIEKLNSDLNKFDECNTFKNKYKLLREQLEHMTHPSFSELQNELQQHFYEVFI